MKYLKKYTESSHSDTIDDIKDILMEIKDIGYTVSVEEYYNWKLEGEDKIISKTGIDITISNESIDLEIISDTITRLYDYMREYQTDFDRIPNSVYIFRWSAHTGERKSVIGWASLDKRYTTSYNDLSEKMLLFGFNKISIKYWLK